MISDERRARLRALRQREAEGSLAESERAELNRIFVEMDAEEAAMLSGAAARLDAEIARVEAENAQLADLLERRQRKTGMYPLRGTTYQYDAPTDPVAETDWEATP